MKIFFQISCVYGKLYLPLHTRNKQTNNKLKKQRLWKRQCFWVER